MNVWIHGYNFFNGKRGRGNIMKKYQKGRRWEARITKPSKTSFPHLKNVPKPPAFLKVRGTICCKSLKSHCLYNRSPSFGENEAESISGYHTHRQL